MPLTMYVDGDRWRSHLRRSLSRQPLLVPVAKGNGYGFTNARLARRAQWLGVDTLAVGTYAELADVAQRFAGDLLVLSPWRPTEVSPEAEHPRRVIHTVGRLEDISALASQGSGRGGGPRVVLELLTSMRRHGFDADQLRKAARVPGLRVEGVALHLPLGIVSHVVEVERLLGDVAAAGLDRASRRGATLWVSHLTGAEIETLASRYPDFAFRPRVGTDLWLGERDALRVRATVLDAHQVERGDRFGYRGRTAPRAGTILVVSGGTAHGIGLESPSGEASIRARAVALARGGLDAAGFVRSPYTVTGKRRLFAEPPHMQVSMLFLPGAATVPAIGAEVDVRVRHTATTFDQVVISQPSSGGPGKSGTD
ncbi:MAG: alanine racemase [Actinomycetota bacterium]|nr:alanine racemase [Actinomycetota bacterium]